MLRKTWLLLPFFLLLVACNSLKYVPEGDYLLNKVAFRTEKDLPPTSEIRQYLHQEPNERFLGLFRLNLAWYNLSGPDTTKRINRILRNLGEPPVIYEKGLTARSSLSMKRFLMSKGFFNAAVDTSIRIHNRRVNVCYTLKGNVPYTIRSYGFEGTPDSIGWYIQEGMAATQLKPGMLLASEALDDERNRIVSQLQRQGYFAISKDYLMFRVDSTHGNNTADVRLSVRPWLPDSLPTSTQKTLAGANMHPVYRINNIYFMMDVPMSSFIRGTAGQTGEPEDQAMFDVADYDTLRTGNFLILYRGKPFVNPSALIQNCRIIPGELYDLQSVERTYSRLNALQLMKYTNIRFREVSSSDGRERKMDCYIVLTPNKKQGFSAEVEGTNTAGDMGVAGNLSFTHRNLFRGAEMMQAKFRGAYEALSTNFQSDYTELGGELSLVLPDFKIPFLNTDFKRKVDANTELTLSYQNMSRPEFLRTVASSTVKYNWTNNRLRQTIDLVDLSYVYMPRVDSTFKATYLTNNSYLKYSYEDHFILRMGYSFSYSSIAPGVNNKTYYTMRGSVESAGNALSAIYTLAGAEKENGFYKIGNISFAQYLKGEFEYAKSVVLSSRNKLAYRAGFGVACPYGNSQILPFEKRFFSGGANSVRGWSVRTLGPGSYKSTSGSIDFMNQSGDVKLDLGAEYRSRLFWKFESALFADAGNIWTIRNYPDQPGGQFHPSTFYKQIASSVGVGLRLDFSYFLARLDLGMKVFDPSLTGADRWRILSIDNPDDFAIHLAIGYPF